MALGFRILPGPKRADPRLLERLEAERVIAAAEAQNRKEQAALAAIEAGTWDRSWVDGALKARGCDPAG